MQVKLTLVGLKELLDRMLWQPAARTPLLTFNLRQQQRVFLAESQATERPLNCFTSQSLSSAPSCLQLLQPFQYDVLDLFQMIL